jgi:hypothetical protein
MLEHKAHRKYVDINNLRKGWNRTSKVKTSIINPLGRPTSTTNINVNIISSLGSKCCQYRLDNKTKLEEDYKKEQI